MMNAWSCGESIAVDHPVQAVAVVSYSHALAYGEPNSLEILRPGLEILKPGQTEARVGLLPGMRTAGMDKYYEVRVS